MGWPCPAWSALKRTPMQDFNSFSIMFYYIFSTKHQKIGDIFCPAIFLDFRTVWRMFQRCIISKSWNFDTISNSFIGFYWVFFIFRSSVSVSSNSSEELRQQIRRHKATRPPIEEEEPEKTNQDSQDSVHSMYSFSNRVLKRLSFSTCLENLLLMEKRNSNVYVNSSFWQ